MKENYPDRCDELANKAANPKTMGGHGQPEGRPSAGAETRDQNHPAGSGNHRPGIETAG